MGFFIPLVSSLYVSLSVNLVIEEVHRLDLTAIGSQSGVKFENNESGLTSIAVIPQM